MRSAGLSFFNALFLATSISSSVSFVISPTSIPNTFSVSVSNKLLLHARAPSSNSKYFTTLEADGPLFFGYLE